MGAPLIITGMHRSGTSFVAELFQSGGLHIGQKLFPADKGNPRGYFEDEEILTLQREMLAKACAADEKGWPDWGWTESGTLDESNWQAYEPALKSLVKARTEHGIWGWKDPRTSLLLDVWLRVLPETRFLFVIREPWKVADSVRRLPAKYFSSAPEIPVRIWMFYNQRLLDFARAHPDRCAILPISWLDSWPEATLRRYAAALDIDGLNFHAKSCRAIVEGRQRDVSSDGSNEEAAFRRDHPEGVRLWRELLTRAMMV